MRTRAAPQAAVFGGGRAHSADGSRQIAPAREGKHRKQEYVWSAANQVWEARFRGCCKIHSEAELRHDAGKDVGVCDCLFNDDGARA